MQSQSLYDLGKFRPTVLYLEGNVLHQLLFVKSLTRTQPATAFIILSWHSCSICVVFYICVYYSLGIAVLSKALIMPPIWVLDEVPEYLVASENVGTET